MNKLILTTVGILGALGFSGCSDNPAWCTDSGYKGIVVSNGGGNLIYCSDGDISPDGLNFITSQGNASIEVYDYYKTRKIKE